MDSRSNGAGTPRKDRDPALGALDRERRRQSWVLTVVARRDAARVASRTPRTSSRRSDPTDEAAASPTRWLTGFAAALDCARESGQCAGTIPRRPRKKKPEWPLHESPGWKPIRLIASRCTFGIRPQFWTWAAVRPGASSPSPRPENEQIECACGSVSGAAPIGVWPPLPGGPVTSPASAIPAVRLATRAAVATAKPNRDFQDVDRGTWCSFARPSEQRRRCAHPSRRALNPGHRERGQRRRALGCGEYYSGAIVRSSPERHITVDIGQPSSCLNRQEPSPPLSRRTDPPC